MKLLRTALLAAAISSISAGIAGAQTTINFDDGSAGSVVGATYAGLGVTFTNASFSAVFGCCSLVHTSSAFQPQPGNPIIALFSGSMTSVSLTGQDIGNSGFLFRAYDALAGGTLVDSKSFFGTDLGVGTNQTLTVTGSNIRRVEFSQVLDTGNGEGLVFDDLTFSTGETVVPEPASVALMAAGLAGVFGVVRRKRNV